MPSFKKQVLVAYVPVLHRGYISLFDKFKNASELYLIDKSTMPEVDYLRKDLRSLKTSQVAELLKSTGRFKAVTTFDKNKHIKQLDNQEVEIIMPDEDVSRVLAGKFKKSKVTLHPVFLRWDRSTVEGLNADGSDKIKRATDVDKKFMNQALEAAGYSSDVWRRVGAVLVTAGNKSNKLSNRSVPDEHTPWIEGDPRSIFKRGVGIEMSLFAHAEASLIAQAAKEGVSTNKATLYVTDYPCPACAKLIATSGIKKLYYKEGYAVLDGARVLSDYGVEVFKINLDNKNQRLKADKSKVPYPKRPAKP